MSTISGGTFTGVSIQVKNCFNLKQHAGDSVRKGSQAKKNTQNSVDEFPAFQATVRKFFLLDRMLSKKKQRK